MFSRCPDVAPEKRRDVSITRGTFVPVRDTWTLSRGDNLITMRHVTVTCTKKRLNLNFRNHLTPVSRHH